MPEIRDTPPTRAPRGERAPRARAATPPSPPPADEPSPPAGIPFTPDERKLAASISGTYSMMGTGLIGIGMRMDDAGIAGSGVSMVNMAEETAAAWIELSRKNPKVKAYLKKITEAGASAVVIGMHIAMFMPLLASRGILPESMMGNMMGTPEPSVNGNAS